MDENIVSEFQQKVSELLLRNKSVLDIMTKYQVTNARVNRALVKAITVCGCITLDGRKNNINFINDKDESQIQGELCEDCRSNIEREIGSNLFYAASMCNALGFSLDSIIKNEISEVEVLGKYNLK